MRRPRPLFLLAGVAALGALLHHLGLDFLIETVEAMGPLFALVCAVHLGVVALDGAALRACLGPRGGDVGFGRSLRAQLVGHAVNGVVPLQAGEVAKFALLGDDLPRDRRLAAVVQHNILMILTDLTQCALVPPVVLLGILGARGPIVGFVLGASLVCLLVALALVRFLVRGAGEWPFALARRLRLGDARVARWRRHWHAVERWRREEPDAGRRAAQAYLLLLLARTVGVAEMAIIVYGLGAGGLPLAALANAGDQLVTWLTTFMPFQAATGEGGAWLLFEAVGAAGAHGVALQLTVKARRLALLAMAGGLLAVGALRWRAPVPAAGQTPQVPP